jgi:hypothetical protein
MMIMASIFHGFVICRLILYIANDVWGMGGGGGGRVTTKVSARAGYSQVVSIGVHSYTQGRAGIIEGSVPIFFLFSLLRIDDTD